MTESAAEEFDSDLLRVAGAVSDGKSVDWDKEASTRPDLSDSLRSLQAVAGVAVACGSELESEEILTQWGRLEIRERIGWGTFGEVYRAYDPVLQLEVALKLLRAGVRPAGEGEILAEARKLARIRHENVLRVYGAAEHDGRFGIWTELLVGETLEELVDASRRFAAVEAVSVGTAICRALAELHRKGIVHQDVKTRNVMRENHTGRIVLMDFGSAGDILESGSGSGPTQGTPITMAPEQIYGRRTGPRTDIWGLGVLLYRLVTGRYPIEANSFEELADKHQRRQRTPLCDVRSDLPAAFVTVVEKALAFDPNQRFASAGEMEQELAKSVGMVYDVPPPRIPWRLIFAAATVAVLLVWLRPKPGPTPVIHAGNLTATVKLFRETKDGAERLLPGAAIRPGDHLYLQILGSAPMYVYVLDSDDQGHAYYLFPGPAFDTKGALSAGVTHRLPGTRHGEDVNWNVTSPGGTETIVVVASKYPQQEFETEIASIPAPQLDAPVTYQEVSPGALQVLRGIGGLAPTPKGQSAVTGALQRLNADSIAASDFWTWQISLQNP